MFSHSYLHEPKTACETSFMCENKKNDITILVSLNVFERVRQKSTKKQGNNNLVIMILPKTFILSVFDHVTYKNA